MYNTTLYYYCHGLCVSQKNYTPENLIEHLQKSVLDTYLVIISSQKKNWSSMLAMWKHNWTHAMGLL